MAQAEDHVILNPRVEIGTRRYTRRRDRHVDDPAAVLAVGMRVINWFGLDPRTAGQVQEPHQPHSLEQVHGFVHRP